MKFYIKKLLNSSLIKSCIEGYNAGIGSIFMLHRIGSPDASILSGNRNLFVSPEFLEETIVYLKRKGFSFISLDEFHEVLTKQQPHKKLITFTLDDGYLDNCTLGYPVFKAYNVPFTIYVTTSFIEGNIIPWWFELEYILINTDLLELEDRNKISVSTFADKERLFFKFREELLAGGYPQERFQQLFANYVHVRQSKLFLDWHDIEKMSTDTLVTFGAHTISHPVLKKLDEPAALKEMQGADIILQRHLKRPIDHIAYPFGGRGEISVREVGNANVIGYKTGVTTLNGNVFLTHRSSMLSLPRIFMYEMDAPQQVEGVMFQNNFIANRGKRIIKL